MNVKEKWLAFSDIAHRVELNLVLSSLGAMGNCKKRFRSSAISE